MRNVSSTEATIFAPSSAANWIFCTYHGNKSMATDLNVLYLLHLRSPSEQCSSPIIPLNLFFLLHALPGE